MERRWFTCRCGSAIAISIRWRCAGLATSPVGACVSPGPCRRWPPILSGVRRGILGGTFDPPHIAHLIAGEAAHEQLGLDVVTFLPAGSPWQKADDLVSPAEHRWAMTVLACEGAEHLVPDDREVRRDGWTYTVDTLAEFSDDELFLILGADAAAGLPTWHRADEVMARSRIAVMPRAGTTRAAVVAAGADPIWLDVPEIPISGTMLRDRRRRGASIRFFVREAVHRYVLEHDLYEP